MPHFTTIKDYDIHLYWDVRAEYFVAEIPEIYSCAADGATQAQALSNLEEAFAVLKESYAEKELNFPRPDPELPISIRQLSALSEVVKISRLAELAGIPGQTIATKLKRGTEFSGDESRKLARALGEQSLAFNHAKQARSLGKIETYEESLPGMNLSVHEPAPLPKGKSSHGAKESRIDRRKRAGRGTIRKA